MKVRNVFIVDVLKEIISRGKKINFLFFLINAGYLVIFIKFMEIKR